MILLSISIIFICLAVGAFIFSTHTSEYIGDKTLPTVVAIVCLVIASASAIISCFTSIPAGHIGVVSVFGRVEDYTLDPGIHMIAPWKSVTKMDNRTQKETIEMSCFSSDIQEVNIKYTVNYQINKDNAQNIYKTIGTDYYNTVVAPKIQESVKIIFAKYTAEKLIASRGGLSKEIEPILIDNLKSYNIDIVTTSIEDIDFTDAFTNAVEAKQVAEQKKLKTQTEEETANLKAEAEAKRSVIKAQADSDAAILAAKAEAEVQQIGADAAEYAGKKDAAILLAVGEQLGKYPALIKYLYYQTWNGELPNTLLGENSQILMNLE